MQGQKRSQCNKSAIKSSAIKLVGGPLNQCKKVGHSAIKSSAIKLVGGPLDKLCLLSLTLNNSAHRSINMCA